MKRIGAPLADLNRLPLSVVLWHLAQDTTRERVSIGDLLGALGDRALGALLFVFAFPNVLPMPPGTSTLLGTPLLFLAVQLLLGRRPWLPAVVAQRSMTRGDFSSLVTRIVPWLSRAERLLRPRLSGLARRPMEYGIGLVCLVLAVVLVLPIPLGNIFPGIAISLLALGILERDGLWVLGGLVMSVFSMAVVSGVLYGMGQAVIYFVTRVLT